MEPLEFMAAVLPSPGNGRYCVAELTKKKEHVYVDDLQEAEAKINLWKQNGCDIYFALGTFGNKNNRKATNVQMVKCIAVDIDCNHPKDVPDENGEIKPKAYPSAKLAVQALMSFCDDIGLSDLGNPWLVKSGGGVHAYWPFKEAVDKDDWKPVADGFKRLCNQKKLAIDNTITGDASRVLRVPDTINTGVKNGNRVRAETQVRLMNEGDLFEFDDVRGLVQRHLVGTAYENIPAPRPSLELPGTRPVGASTLEMFKNSVTRFKNILIRTKNGTGCEQIKFYAENASDDGMEPLWRGLLSIAKHCEDSEKATAWLSDLHPYDHERMHKKLYEIKGPYGCIKLDEQNPGVCPSCPHWGKITNPLALGRDTAVTKEEKTVHVGKAAYIRPEPPFGYAYGKNGGVFIEKEEEDAHGNKIKVPVMIVSHDLFPVAVLKHEAEHTVQFMANLPQGMASIDMPMQSTMEKGDSTKLLAKHRVIASFGGGNDKNLANYVRACVEKMNLEKAPIEVPTSYGWQDNKTFVYAGKIFVAHTPPITVPMVGLENIIKSTKPTGSVEGAREFINLLIRKKMYGHLSVILMGAAAPLMRFTGIYGLTIHCGSTESGTGKSLALDGAASIWGHPVHYRTGKGTSPITMQQRLGLLNSCPLITDEITAKNRKDFEWFPEFLLDMTEGRGKERMESGANKERINNSTWMSLAIMSSNTHVVDYLTGGRKHASEGELRRLIEFIMDENLTFDANDIEIIKSLAHNYGVLGEALAQYMVDNYDKLVELVPKCVHQAVKEFKATNDERFWMAGIGAQLAMAIVLSDTDLLNMPMAEIIADMHKRIDYMRSSIRSGKRSADDVLNRYISEYSGKFVIINYGEKTGLGAIMGDGSMISRETTKSEVMGRVENGLTLGYKDFYIEERLLKAFCTTMSFGYSDFKKQMESQYAVSYFPKKDMMAGTNGPQMRVSVIKISRREGDDTLSLEAA